MSVLENLTEEECYLIGILQDVSGIDVAEFAMYSAEHEESRSGEHHTDGCWRAWPFQYAWYRDKHPQQIDHSARAMGKALDVDTPIPTPSGFVRMGDLKTGDYVYGGDGQPVRIVRAWDPMDDRPCYAVRFSDGSVIIADDEHLWVTRTKNERRKGSKGSVRTTREIRETLHIGKARKNGWAASKNHSIPVAPPVSGAPQLLPLDPYVLGYWLGDGNADSGVVTIGKEDQASSLGEFEANGYVHRQQPHSDTRFSFWRPEEWTLLPFNTNEVGRRATLTADEVRDIRQMTKDGLDPFDKYRYVASKSVLGDVIKGRTYRGVGGWIRTSHKSFGMELGSLGVLNDKHIPDAYLNAPYEDRLALLQGFMDADGHIDKNGYCEISQVSPRLGEDLMVLLCGMGQKPTVRLKIPTLNGRQCNPVAKITFAPRNLVPFRLERKACRLKVVYASETRVGERRIVAVDPVPSRTVRCITVDAEDGIFLAGETHIPTHNSASAVIRSMAFPFNYIGEEMTIVAPEKIHLTALTGKIETELKACRLTREMLVGQGGRNSFGHEPFEARFANGSKILGRIPQHDGRGLKGCVDGSTPILTNKGYVNADELSVGDVIWTHKDEFLPITRLDVFEGVPCYTVEFADDTSITTSWDHCILGTYDPDDTSDMFYEMVERMVGKDFYAATQDFSLVAVKNVYPDGERTVYNPVTDNHTYLTESVVSHNIHSTLLEMDEAQDLPEAAFEEAVETVLTSVKGSVQRIHGVTKGVRGYFYSYTQPGSGWKVHRILAMDRPTWTAQEREDKILKYGGSRDDPNFRRNVYGAHGDSTQNLFVASRLLKCVDMNEDSDYNRDEYTYIRITDETLRDTDLSVEDLIDPPRDHVRSKKYLSFWCGMDIGWTIAPSEIVVFGEMMNPKKDGETIFKLLTRVSLIRVKSPEQRAAMTAIMDIYKPKVFAFDSTGAGLPLLHELEHNRPDLLKLIRGYNFSSKILVGIDPSVEVSQELGEDLAKEAGIMQNTQERGQDVLRELVDAQRLLLPADRGVIGQFEGGTAQTLRRPDQYGRTRVFSKGEDHCIAEGSLIHTARGLVPIEEVVVGDSVLTRVGMRKVVDARMTSPAAEVWAVDTAGGALLEATSDHLVFADGEWVRVRDLRPGMTVVHPATTSKILSVGPCHVKPVYDLTVEGQPEFFAEGILVHNCLDAARMFALGWSQQEVDALLERPEDEEVNYVAISF